MYWFDTPIRVRYRFEDLNAWDQIFHLPIHNCQQIPGSTTDERQPLVEKRTLSNSVKREKYLSIMCGSHAYVECTQFLLTMYTCQARSRATSHCIHCPL